MKKVLLLLFILSLVVMVACTPAAQEAMEANEDYDVEMDVHDGGVTDVVVEETEDETQVTLDINDVTQQAVVSTTGTVDFCVPGSTYTYGSAEGSVDSLVIGLEMYKGREWCKSHALSTVETPVGVINMNSTYYFDNTYNEFWVVTIASTSKIPQGQIDEVHIVNGVVV